MIPELRRPVVWGIGILLFASLGVAATEDSWIEVKSPNFIVMSNASVKQARKTAMSLEQFRLLIKNAFPALRIDPGTPLTAFAAKDEKSFRALIDEENPQKNASEAAGLFAGGPERRLVMMRIDLPEDQAYHVTYHEYVHMLLSLSLGDIPLWLNEGLSEFLVHATLSDGRSALGAPGPQLLEILKTQPLLPLTTLLSVNHDSPYYHDKDKTPIFYAQSWVLTHYLMVGDQRAHAKQLDEFLQLIKKGTSDQEAAVKAFGDLKSLEKALSNYVRSPAFYRYSLQTKLPVEADQYEVRTLSPVESLTARGELLVYVRKFDRARQMLEQSLQLDPRSARANEAMGQLYSMMKDRGHADTFFSAAADLDSNSYLAQFYSAQSKLQQGRDEDLSLAETQLRKAITINPNFAAAYRQLSHVLQRKNRLPEALSAAEKAVLLEPGILSHGLNATRIMIDMGRVDEARDRAWMILAIARTEEDRSHAESLLSHIQNIQDRKANVRGGKSVSAGPRLTARQPQEEDGKEQRSTF